MQLAVHRVAVVDNLCCRLPGPGNNPQATGIGLEYHVGVRGLNEFPVVIGVLASYRLNHDTFGQFGVAQIQVLLGRDELAAGVARHIGDQNLYLRDLVLL